MRAMSALLLSEIKAIIEFVNLQGPEMGASQCNIVADIVHTFLLDLQCPQLGRDPNNFSF